MRGLSENIAWDKDASLFVHSHRQHKRAIAFFIFPLTQPQPFYKGILLALAGGMGGPAGEAIASKLAVDKLLQAYDDDAGSNLPDSLEKSFPATKQRVNF
jgi:serine/threonine protein phosphatase PrpC